MGALVALWATGQTINLMALGGLALAIGILVDEATVEVENIHVQMEQTDSMALAVRRGNTETAVPRLLAMLCILAVFVPVFFMQGAVGNMFKPLALAVSFSMITSYLLSSMFVPVVSVWLLRGHVKHADHQASPNRKPGVLERLQSAYAWAVERLVRRRWWPPPRRAGSRCRTTGATWRGATATWCRCRSRRGTWTPPARWGWCRSSRRPTARSFSATWPRCARGRCPASTTGSTCAAWSA
jgi:hypothetical protein